MPRGWMARANHHPPPTRQVRAVFDAGSIWVYQAYGHDIADAALAAGTFVSPFSTSRMTWIKPSFLWMMYRCGWGAKPGQERVLAIRLTREGFEQALAESCLSHFDSTHFPNEAAWRERLRGSPVRVQWDPERSADGHPLHYRSLQVGLSDSAVTRYVTQWILAIEDITNTLPARRQGIRPLPPEQPYPLPPSLAQHIAANR